MRKLCPEELGHRPVPDLTLAIRYATMKCLTEGRGYRGTREQSINLEMVHRIPRIDEFRVLNVLTIRW